MDFKSTCKKNCLLERKYKLQNITLEPCSRPTHQTSCWTEFSCRRRRRIPPPPLAAVPVYSRLCPECNVYCRASWTHGRHFVTLHLLESNNLIVHVLLLSGVACAAAEACKRIGGKQRGGLIKHPHTHLSVMQRSLPHLRLLSSTNSPNPELFYFFFLSLLSSAHRWIQSGDVCVSSRSRSVWEAPGWRRTPTSGSGTHLKKRETEREVRGTSQHKSVHWIAIWEHFVVPALKLQKSIFSIEQGIRWQRGKERT